MPLGVLTSAAAVLSTVEFCAAPSDGGTGEPQFCRLGHEQGIGTPHCSVVVGPHFLVGVHQDGRRLLAQPSQWQSQVYFGVEVSDEPDPSGGNLPEEEVTINAVKWQSRDESLAEMTARKLTAQVRGKFFVLRYGFTPLGAEFAGALESMVQSVRIVAI